jgi:hypothetical protein
MGARSLHVQDKALFSGLHMEDKDSSLLGAGGLHVQVNL